MVDQCVCQDEPPNKLDDMLFSLQEAEKEFEFIKIEFIFGLSILEGRKYNIIDIGMSF